jgi:hypothetical protein
LDEFKHLLQYWTNVKQACAFVRSPRMPRRAVAALPAAGRRLLAAREPFRYDPAEPCVQAVRHAIDA